MSDAAVDTSSEITTKVRLDAARPFGLRALLPPERCLARAAAGLPRTRFRFLRRRDLSPPA